MILHIHIDFEHHNFQNQDGGGNKGNLLLATGFSVVTVRVHGCPRDRHTTKT